MPLPLLLPLVALLGLLPLRAGAQGAAPPLSDAATISLLTILPGDEVYSAWGHSAFRVHDPARDLDAVFNYGTFAFEDPFFLPKFAYGRLDYLLSVEDFARTVLLHQRYTGRPMIEQTLALTPSQRDAVWAFLVENARPENREYRYHFLRDNCSTRLRDVLIATLGDEITFHPFDYPETTFRGLIDPYVAGAPWTDFGIDLVLGLPLDEEPTPFEAMFLPDYLLRGFDAATVEVGGAARPLVARKDTVFWIEGYARSHAALPWPALVGWTLFAVGVGATVYGARRGVRRRWADVLFLGVLGVAGLVIAFEWFVALHDVTDANGNLFWAWPTHLVAAFVLARGGARWLSPYLGAAAAVALVMAAGWPFWPQALHPAVLPLLLLITVRGGLYAWTERQPRTDPMEAA